MTERVDWSNAVDHMRDEHDTTPVVADEAVNDLDALWIDPDPSSKSGMSVRVIGYSATGRGAVRSHPRQTRGRPERQAGWRLVGRELLARQ